MEVFLGEMLLSSKLLLPFLSLLILLRCLRSMLSGRYDSETWAWLRVGKEKLPVTHWESILGAGHSADVQLKGKGVARSHAVLRRSDKGEWAVFSVFGRQPVWVNGVKAGPRGLYVTDGDTLKLGSLSLRFQDLSGEAHRKLEEQRQRAGLRVRPFVTLLLLTLFEGLLLLELSISVQPEHLSSVALAFAVLAALEWFIFLSMRLIGRSGFEIELLAFYLSSLGLCVAASSTPGDMLKQTLLILSSVLLFLLLGFWMRNLKRTTLVRGLVAVGALGLLAVNVVASEEVLGARNWLELGGYSFQPSELVKVAYLYVGASTLDRLYRHRNLVVFIVFSAVCVIAMALIGDFGTALVFFCCFLVISFLRSGSIGTVFLALTGAGLFGFLAVSVKPHIAQRFASWGHVWEDMYNAGYQQTRALSAAASGGLLGKGAGNGWLKSVVAANTDMVFALVSEELGLIVAFCMVLAVVILAFFAFRAARRGRSAYYAIAACGAVTILLTQTALNVFGSLDLLPFTGVTFPFVSRGGSSLLSCWMMMAFLKGADTRRDASFVVRPARRSKEAA